MTRTRRRSTALAITAATMLMVPASIIPASAAGPIVTLPGTFNAALGCASDWQPDCENIRMDDPEADGTYTFSTDQIPGGAHRVKVSESQSWDVNFGVGGAPGGADYEFTVADGKNVTFSYDTSTKLLDIEVEDPPASGIGQSLGYWLAPDLLAWPANLDATADGTTLELWSAPNGGMTLDGTSVAGGTKVADLAVDDAGIPADALAGKHQLSSYLALRATTDGAALSSETAASLLQGQVAVVQRNADGEISVMTGVQIAGVLDSLYAQVAESEGRERGAVVSPDGVALNVWAPTAQNVQLVLNPSGEDGEPHAGRLPMTREADGSWSIEGTRDWVGQSYLYEVTVYVPSTGQVETNLVTDPFSRALTLNSTASIIIDLDDPALAPNVWANAPMQTTEVAAQQTIYELHVRDFSISDETVPEELRGTYAAFGVSDSDGMTHLRELSEAGLTTVHLLPTFDIATIEEDRDAQLTPDIPADAGRDSDAQQAALNEVKDQDAFNWGYDPLHFSVPEGSYASEGNQEGGARTHEFRTMVGALHEAGLGVVLDQVFNHTAASGQDAKSVLDRVVPGYYHRLTPNGSVETSTCCQNVATENAFAEQLMIDSVLMWARDYKVDGFRFDLMGHHSRENMENVRAALDSLTLDKDGVDGKSIYLYGEGWNFGEVENNSHFEQASQGQLGGTGIGAFNDRLRDAVHGGGPFDADKRSGQGFGTGGYTDPNGISEATPEEQYADLLHRTDLVRLGMAGNLRDYTFVTSAGVEQAGHELDYNGASAGYATQPHESVNYVDAHDNETLWDLGLWKLPQDTSVEDRVRMNNLSLATVALGQSPAFWHAGTDMLRSKSMDRDSYNSGDHFNVLDFSMQTNNQGVGLPPAEKNQADWEIVGPILANESLQPSPSDIRYSADLSLDLLKIRSSSRLFTLGNAEAIQEKVTFPNGGAEATAGLLVMRIDDTVGADVDPALDGVVTVFNASPKAITESIQGLDGQTYRLHSVQAEGADEVVKQSTLADGTVSIPARTVAVFVLDQDQPQQPADPEGPENPEAPLDPPAGEDDSPADLPAGDDDVPSDPPADDENRSGPVVTPGKGETAGPEGAAPETVQQQPERGWLARTGTSVVSFLAATLVLCGAGAMLMRCRQQN